jgi:hypothetical protein
MRRILEKSIVGFLHLPVKRRIIKLHGKVVLESFRFLNMRRGGAKHIFKVKVLLMRVIRLRCLCGVSHSGF